MKVVVRSSSLFFTLLSIILDVPIQRTKRSGTSDGTGTAKDSTHVTGASEKFSDEREAVTVAAPRGSGSP